MTRGMTRGGKTAVAGLFGLAGLCGAAAVYGSFSGQPDMAGSGLVAMIICAGCALVSREIDRSGRAIGE